MQIELVKGVNLKVLSTQKFKTVSIRINFKSLIDANEITKRALLANILSTNSQHYPTQTDYRTALSELYGAQLSSDVSKVGKYHVLTLDLDIVDETYLNETGLFEKATEFLKSILFYPNVYDGAFHKETFQRELENLKDEYEAVYEDKQEFAGIETSRLYFDTLEQQIPSWGRLEDLTGLSQRDLYAVYQDMILNDKIDIVVLGDLEEERVKKAFVDFNFKARTVNNESLFYSINEVKDVTRKKEIQPITQAKLNLAYKTTIYYHQDYYYAGQVFNGLFGGFPHSNLFTILREQEGLAYDIASGIDSFNGVLYVQSGIESTKAIKVEKLVAEQLNSIQEGAFSEDVIFQTKALLKNALIQSEDHAESLIEKYYSFNLIDKPMISLVEWADRIDAVSKQDIIDVAKTVELKAVFLLSGE